MKSRERRNLPRKTNKQMFERHGIYRGAGLNDSVPNWIRELVETGDFPRIKLSPKRFKWQAPRGVKTRYSKRIRTGKHGEKEKRRVTKPTRQNQTQKARSNRFNENSSRRRRDGTSRK